MKRFQFDKESFPELIAGTELIQKTNLIAYNQLRLLSYLVRD